MMWHTRFLGTGTMQIIFQDWGNQQVIVDMLTINVKIKDIWSEHTFTTVG